MSVFSGSREWVYYRDIKGRFQRIHRITGPILILLMLVMPWLSIGGNPVILADLPARRLYLLGQLFTATDGFLVVLGAMLAAFLLFVVSALYGRMWCGWMCPQTVFMEEWVRRVEIFFEGDGLKRKRRDSKAWNHDKKLLRKVAKTATLTALAVLISGTTMSYFGGARDLWTGNGGSVEYALVGIIAASALADWLWFREQLCIYVCPYARFQSALTDDDSLMVLYNKNVPIGKGKAAALKGDCIDCGKCVNVCPQGIDIRDGFQLECINCALCVDACTSVMNPLGHETLVRYSTMAADEGRPPRRFRFRTVAYTLIVTGLSVALFVGVFLHNPIEANVHRTPGSLYQVDDDGMIRNTYLLRVVNNDPVEQHAFAIGVTGPEDLQVSILPMLLGPGEDRTVPLVVRVPQANVGNTEVLQITVRNEAGSRVLHTTFNGPTGATP